MYLRPANFPPLVTLRHFINKRICLERGYRHADGRRSSVPQMFLPGEQIKSRAILSRGISSSFLDTYIIAVVFRSKRRSPFSLCRNCTFALYCTFSHFPCPPRTLLFLPPSPPASPPPLSYFIQAHHRSLTAGYRCFHHSPKGPRLPLPRSYLAPFLLFPAYPSRVRVPSPRLIIFALIGSEEFHIG